jgi:hypothetical protein
MSREILGRPRTRRCVRRRSPATCRLSIADGRPGAVSQSSGRQRQVAALVRRAGGFLERRLERELGPLRALDRRDLAGHAVSHVAVEPVHALDCEVRRSTAEERKKRSATDMSTSYPRPSGVRVRSRSPRPSRTRFRGARACSISLSRPASSTVTEPPSSESTSSAVGSSARMPSASSRRWCGSSAP